jgi:hypothetical protein
VAGAIGERVKKVIAPGVWPYLVQHRLPPMRILTSIEWDVLHACMEMHFADFVSPGIYSRMLELYYEGHFPCGWEGKAPEGRLLVL